MQKNIISLLLFSVVCLLVFSLGVFAEEPTDNWNDEGNVAAGFADGTGTYDEPYIIENESQLAYFSKSSSDNNYYDNKFVEITAKELDMGAHYWTPFKFNGYLQGNNCVIGDLIVSEPTRSSSGSFLGCGFFSEINTDNNGGATTGNIVTVENIHFTNPKITPSFSNLKSRSYGGVLAGYAGCSRISNCTVSGGIVTGYDSNNSNAIIGLSAAGGLIGQVDTRALIEDFSMERCSSTSTVSGRTVGGLIGSIHSGTRLQYTNTVIIANCWTGGNIEILLDPVRPSAIPTYGGGLVGYIGYRSYGANIENCFTTSTISGHATNAGGLVGSIIASGSASVQISGEVNITNSVALNPSISSSNEGTINAGRIVESGETASVANKCFFANTYALDSMEVLGRYVADDETSNGTGVSRERTQQESFWTEQGFNISETGIWNWDESTQINGHPELNNNLLTNEMALVIVTEPKNATAYKGADAMFGVIPAGGARGYTYQWQFRASGTGGSGWADIGEATNATLSAAYNGEYTDGTEFRCVVKDRADQTVESQSATLTIIKSNYTAADALKELKGYYNNKGTMTQAKEAFALNAAGVDTQKLTAQLPFFNTYSRNRLLNIARQGYFPWVLMDSYAQGLDPHFYVLTGDGSSQNLDMLAYILNVQDESTGNISLGFQYFPMRALDLPSIILGLEMYFEGDIWGNESEGTKLGRDGAIEYFLTQLKDHESGGLIFGEVDKVYGTNEYKNTQYQRTQAEAAILAARLIDDPQWGDEAGDALDGLLKTLDYLYENRDEDETVSSFKYTESLARYVSALVAASNTTDNFFKKYSYLNTAENILNDDILPAKTLDGSYNTYSSQSSMNGDADAAAAVLLALSDFDNGSCALAEYIFSVPAESAVALDLGAITINSPVTGDLTLPTEGANGSKITWETSDRNTIALNGKVNRTTEDVTVTLTATAVKDGATATKAFELTVKADADAETDGVDAALAALSVPIEAINDITLGGSSVDGVTVGWSSDKPTVITNEGVVTRPAKGSGDEDVILTATASQGSVTKTKEFPVKVYAMGDSLEEAYYMTRAKYLATKSIGGYWNIWAAYAALGDYITDPANGYTLAIANPSNDWYGTQYGATVLALSVMGENPYNYNGRNWVQLLSENKNGPFAGSLFTELGMEAAGASIKYDFTPSAAAGISGTAALTSGIDIAGWATVLLAAHHDEVAADQSARAFINHLKNTMGISESGNFKNGEGNVNYISTAAGVTGMAALLSVGYADADVSQWTNSTTGKSPVDAMLQESLIENQLSGYRNQAEIAICDLYNAKYKEGTSVWLAGYVNKTKLETEIAKANEILAVEADYTPESIATLKAALETANSISQDRLDADFADYGEEYYALFDAVRFAEVVGQEEIDREAAAAVAETINALPAKDDVTVSDKDNIEAARAAYNGLTAKQKTYVEATVLAKLTDAEAQLATLTGEEADKEAANTVNKTLNALPAAKNITLSDKETVEAARAAYNALTDGQKTLVNADALARLEAAEAKIQELSGKEVVDINNITDIDKDAWYYDDVAYVLGNGIFKGVSATEFSPSATMTRAQFVTVLGRYAGISDSTATYPAVTMFSDVVSRDYYASHVKWAVENGITNGTSATTFDPNADISRQDMATMMLRFARVMNITLPEADTNLFADDSQIRDYAKEAVYRLKAAGILNGKENNNFDPNGNTLRSEVAAVLHRFLTMEENTDSVIVDLEKFTLGQGFVIEPTVVELRSGDTAASVLERLAAANGIETDGGNTSMGYYLKAVKDNDTSEAVFPQYIIDRVAAANGTLEGRGTENWLGEFDYYNQSGWMVTVNNSFLPVSAGNWEVRNGDVIRWQFSVCGLGRDIGQSNGEADPAYIQTADKGALVTAIATATDEQKATEAYTKAMEVMQNLPATQEEVDAATAALQQ